MSFGKHYIVFGTALAVFAMACDSSALSGPDKSLANSTAALSVAATSCVKVRAVDTALVVGETSTLRIVRDNASRSSRNATKIGLTSRNPAILSVEGTTVARANGVGRTYIVATLQGCVDSVALRVLAVDQPPPPPSAAIGIPLTYVRSDNSVTAARFQNAIPLQQGALFPSDTSKLRLLIGGVEVRAAFRTLRGRFPDGSYRSLAVQGSASLGVVPVSGRLQIGQTASAYTSWSTTFASDSTVALLPSEPSYLISTGLFGRTVPVSQSTVPSYEQQFTSFADSHWTADAAQWEYANYYDRAMNHFVYWARSGDTRYWFRALALSRNYRRLYLEANAFNPSPHWSQLEGIAIHYWLTGDENSRIAVERSAGRLVDGFSPSSLASPTGVYIEGRIQQRLIIASILAMELEDSARPWRTLAGQYVSGMMGQQRADGSFSWPNWCNGQGNFMVGLQNDAAIKYFERVSPDARILPFVTKSVDWLWQSQWIGSAASFRFATGCGVSDLDAAAASPDLNMLIAVGYAWVGNRTGSGEYKVRADAIALGAIANSWLVGSKQFNQQFYNSHTWLFYRQ